MGKGNNKKGERKKGGRHDEDEHMGARAEEFSDEEIGSQGTNIESVAATTMSADLSEEFPQQVDNLTDSSGPRRIKALLDILKNLKAGVDLSAYVLSFRDDIAAGIVWVLRRHQMETEGVLAMQLACIFALVVGADDDAYFMSLQDALMFAATRSSSAEIRKWAVTSLSFISFICSSDVNVSVWNFCGDVMCGVSEAEKPTPAVQAAAADAWVLLSSTMSPTAVTYESNERLFPVVVKLMGESDTDVKVSAGECLAYLWEAAVEAGDDDLASADCDVIGATLSKDEELVAAALQMVEDISKEHSKKVSKKDRKEQRAAYRLLVDWIVRGEKPHDSVRMGGATVEANSFARLRLLEVLRQVLGDAFQTALRAFPVLRSVLDVEHFTMDFMDGGGEDRRVEKGSSRSKKRTNIRNQERRFRDINKAY